MYDWSDVYDYDSYDYQDVSTPDYGGDSYDYGGSEQAGWQGGADYAGGGSYDGGFDTGYDGGWSPTADTGYDGGWSPTADTGAAGYDAGYTAPAADTYDSYDYQGYQEPAPAAQGGSPPAQEYDSYDYQGTAAAPTTQATGLRVPDRVSQAPSAVAPAATSQDAVTGTMGGRLPTTGDFSRMDRGQQPALASDSGSGNVLKDGYNAVRRFANENKELTSLGIKAFSALAGGRRRTAPNRVQGTSAQAAPTAQLERAATNNARNDAIAQQVAERATTNNARNDAITQQREVIATQAVADVNNIDPQRTAIDAMNRTQARARAAAERGEDEMRSRGQSQATIDAQRRKNDMELTRAGYQSYAQGWDQGASQRRAGLRDASSLYPKYDGTAYQPYGGLDTASFRAGQELNQQQNAQSSNRTAGLVSLFEDALGNPTRRTREQEYLA